MKVVYEEYKKNIKELLNNKTYVFSIILVAILSYGFAITNFSVGIDDLCFDRYVMGTYLLSAGRWGTTAIYVILQIFQFTPFWLELIVVILTVIMGIIFSAFLRKECYSKLKNIHYIIATAILISYPMLHQSFIYQSTNLSVIISNLALMIIPILIYEKFSQNQRFKICLMFSIILPFFISMYESCCQTYILMTFIIALIQICNDREDYKNIIKYILISILTLICGLVINFYISFIIKGILNVKGVLKPDYSSKAIPWIDFKNNNILELLKNNIINKLYKDFMRFSYIKNFIILSALSLIITIIKSIKEKKYILIPLITVIIFSNFIINLLQVRVLYRTDTSWCLAIAFFAIFILMNVSDKTFNNILCVLFCIIILFQTKQMNQFFYNDYIRYKKEANYAYSIANEIISESEYTKKPIVYVYKEHDGTNQNRINQDNGWSLINWSSWAFGEPGSELTKFINSLGYNFITATNEQTIEAKNDIENLEIIENKNVYETDKYIIVKIDYNI